MALYDDVYGLSYKSAEEKTQILAAELKEQSGKGFGSVDELEEWAHDHLLDKVVYMTMSKKFFCVSHKGELLQPSDFENYYKNILSYTQRQGNRIIDITWVPEGYSFYDKAYIAAEQSDGVHKPLYYRDYTVPSGYYSEERDAFNVAKPFPVFAKNTGRDTSYIYTYIQHIAGECAPWLLAWLRAKLLYPTVKTQVVPIIVSRTQGSGKTTFAEVICKGLFGKDNVIVSDQYDSTARFNADYADALIVCQEEKEETDRRNPAGALKSRATATTIRKEQKGIDPIYQESYTDFIMTTNKDVPIKFDGREDQRRFMIMEADPHFTRKESDLADEVFSKLYGFDANFNKVGVPFQEDKDLIAQFKHELFTREDIAKVPLRNFPKTAAYNRCFSLPRTTEATEIESILRAIGPFIRESLQQEKLVTELPDAGKLSDYIQVMGAIQYMPAYKDFKKMVVVCRPLVFYDMATNRPYPHSTVERGVIDCAPWLVETFGISVLPTMEPLPGGFAGVAGRHKLAPTVRFALADNAPRVYDKEINTNTTEVTLRSAERIGQRVRVNSRFKPDPNGCFETVNEMKPGVGDLTNKSQNVQYMDTFLLESDETSHLNKQLEKQRAEEWELTNGSEPIPADMLYSERLQFARKEAERIFNDGIACRLVYSGAKSYHLLIRVKDAPQTLEEYSWLHAYLCTSVSDKLIFDESTSDPARLTRSPIELQRYSVAYGIQVEGTQGLIAENWDHVYDIRWRSLFDLWKKRPLKQSEQVHGRRLMPTRKEYQEAVEAIIDTTFWTDSKWDGERQRCFFPAYRILRLLGYTHAQLWDEGMMTKGVENYKHRDEISYWKTRSKSSIVQQIDQQVDEYEEALNGQ